MIKCGLIILWAQITCLISAQSTSEQTTVIIPFTTSGDLLSTTHFPEYESTVASGIGSAIAPKVTNDSLRPLVLFYGRYACNVNINEDYCPRDTYTAMSFYYGMVEGGMNTDGTFTSSSIMLKFKDPTVIFKKKDLKQTYPLGGSFPAYSDMAMDDLMFGNESVVAVVGFEGDCKEVSYLADAYESMALMVQCTDGIGESKFPIANGVQMATTMGALYRGFAAMAKSIGWTNVAIINMHDDGRGDRSDHDQLLDALSKQGIDVDYTHKGKIPTYGAVYSGAESWMRIVKESYLKTRIYVMIIEDPLDITLFMDSLYNFGLLETGKYVVIGIEPVPKIDPIFETFLTSYSNNRDMTMKTCGNGGAVKVSNPMVRNYYRSLFMFTDIATVKPNFNNEWNALLKKIYNKDVNTSCPPLCDRKDKNIYGYNPFTSNDMEEYDYSASTAMGNAYDAGKLLATMINNGQTNPLNASQFSQLMKQQSYKSQIKFSLLVADTLPGIFGYDSSFDSQGIAMREYMLWSPQKPAGGLGIYEWAKIAAKVLPNGMRAYTVEWNNLTQLGVLHGKLPESKPKCGFNMELCPRDYSQLSELEIVIIAATSVCTIALVVVLYFAIRRVSYERRLQTMYFLVNRSQVYLRDKTKWKSTFGSAFQTTAALQGLTYDPREKSDANKPKNLINFYQQNITKAIDTTKKKMKIKKKDTKKADRWTEIIDWELGEYKGKLVALRRIQKESLKLTRPMKEELDKLMKMNHDNLNPFYGIINEGNLIFTIHAFAVRDTLNDVLRNTDMRLDKFFKNSFIFDLIKGIGYLHDNSGIGYHGNLKSTNCLIDEYWRIRLSSFGMEQIRMDEPPPSSREMLWTAPEIVRRHNIKYDLDKNQLTKADIYSFGIIIYEIYGREGPFGDDDLLDTNEIIEQVKFPRGNDVTRPDLSLLKRDAPDQIIQSLPSIWHEDPKRRPAISWIRKSWKEAGISAKDNLADNIMALFDRYTNNLEGLVKEKTQELEEEKIRNENLLLQLLPRSVANCLKDGRPVEAEFYDSVTIYFSDVVGFTALSSKSTPMQIVNMLNSLYTQFDLLIDKFDCYKVETIGDAYMYVSGLPDTNDMLHAGEVAASALELLEIIKTYVVPHAEDEKLRLRIGLHTGCVVTGVVGVKMPRYCLFGANVHIASRMESSGEPMRVQISDTTYHILEDNGGYEMQLRTDPKKPPERRTYWLHAYNKQHRLDRLKKETERFPRLNAVINKSIKAWNLH
ncbi:hypothetical protein WR25_19954 isoform F [Diploscapter pachys]|uniref:guanylate cyclase n=3 Tax=Diploscapter pachys TaxID=2018661 RepID=A0A2A2KAS6_9BILA|nr:hypothetical protein WR25_19954 isoform F [Diploscapter pachys]